MLNEFLKLNFPPTPAAVSVDGRSHEKENGFAIIRNT